MTASNAPTAKAARTAAGSSGSTISSRSIASLIGYVGTLCSFVLFDTKARATVIGFEREDDAEAFRREFIE